MRRRRRRRRWWLAAIQLLLCLALLEGALHLARRWSEGLRLLLHLPESSEDYEGVATVEQLLDRTIIGYRPLTTRGGFVLNTRGYNYTSR